ncbi:MAG: type IA DNA topoisomerase, partial [Lachnospiraceae bacterium]|nr:type IA DNA topoisomerase [Lachnospiraceae bacterium]
KTKYVNDSKITDHYAIIPTGQGFENYDKLADLKKEVYKLIVKRFIAIFYPAAEYNKVNMTIEVENEQFFASGKVCTNQGYLEVLKNRIKSDEEEKDLNAFANLKKGQEIKVVNYETKDSETSPPSRYNSGGMVLAMENAGVCTSISRRRVERTNCGSM